MLAAGWEADACLNAVCRAGRAHTAQEAPRLPRGRPGGAREDHGQAGGGVGRRGRRGGVHHPGVRRAGRRAHAALRDCGVARDAAAQPGRPRHAGALRPPCRRHGRMAPGLLGLPPNGGKICAGARGWAGSCRTCTSICEFLASASGCDECSLGSGPSGQIIWCCCRSQRAHKPRPPPAAAAAPGTGPAA